MHDSLDFHSIIGLILSIVGYACFVRRQLHNIPESTRIQGHSRRKMRRVNFRRNRSIYRRSAKSCINPTMYVQKVTVFLVAHDARLPSAAASSRPVAWPIVPQHPQPTTVATVIPSNRTATIHEFCYHYYYMMAYPCRCRAAPCTSIPWPIAGRYFEWHCPERVPYS